MEIIGSVLSAVLAKANTLSWLEGTEMFFLLMVILGQHLIAKRDKRGFMFWIASNFAAIIVMLALERWIMVVLYLYLMYSSFVGFVTWSVMERKQSEGKSDTDRSTAARGASITTAA